MLKEKEKFVKKMTKIYEDIRDNFGKELQEENQIFICPYCQRSYIGIFDNDNSKKGYTAPDLDHFFPKSKYPFLAATISNLIPACSVCNQRLKGSKDTYEQCIPNPIEIEKSIFDNINFNYCYNMIYIENLEGKTSEIQNYIEFFKIQEQYSMHTEIVNDIKVKMNKYNKVKKDHLSKCCPSLNEKIIEDMVFHEYKYIEKKKTPLWKLKEDIYKKIKKENEAK
jgi:5-methylcytosine-specific restriction endonuclease McrA